MFPKNCSRLMSNMEECMNIEEYLWNVEELINSSTFHFPQCCSRLLSDVEVFKYVECGSALQICKNIWKNEFIHPHSSFHNVPAQCSTLVALS